MEFLDLILPDYQRGLFQKLASDLLFTPKKLEGIIKTPTRTQVLIGKKNQLSIRKYISINNHEWR